MPRILAFDTTRGRCAAAAADGRGIVERAEEMRIGHAERLFPLIEEALAAAGFGYRDLDRIAVAVGPGSFSGIRIGVAAARGLASALRIPAVGVTVLEALAEEAARRCGGGREIVAANAAPLGRVFVQRFRSDGDGVAHPRTEARMAHPAEAAEAADAEAVFVGDAAAAFGAEARFGRSGCADLGTLAAVAARRGAADGRRPAPLYLRPPDAAPRAAA